MPESATIILFPAPAPKLPIPAATQTAPAHREPTPAEARLTRALANAWAPKIAVNSVAPGVIPFDKFDDRIERFIAATPAGRAGTGDEVAEAVVHFLSCTRFITGQVMAVDGGLSQR